MKGLTNYINEKLVINKDYESAEIDATNFIKVCKQNTDNFYYDLSFAGVLTMLHDFTNCSNTHKLTKPLIDELFDDYKTCNFCGIFVPAQYPGNEKTLEWETYNELFKFYDGNFYEIESLKQYDWKGNKFTESICKCKDKHNRLVIICDIEDYLIFVSY